MGDAARHDRFRRLADQLAELIEKTDDPTAHRATAAALLHHKVPGVSWTGFYLLKNGELVVDAYQGPVACLELERHVGVCWASLDRAETVIVDDVDTFPGHIPCDARSRSEIVVPLTDRAGTPIGVLDVDSHRPGHFDEVDAEGYELIVSILQEKWNRSEGSS